MCQNEKEKVLMGMITLRTLSINELFIIDGFRNIIIHTHTKKRLKILNLFNKKILSLSCTSRVSKK